MPAKNRTISLCPKKYFKNMANFEAFQYNIFFKSINSSNFWKVPNDKYKFFSPFSFLVNVANLKSLIGTCQCLVVGEDSLTGLTDHHGPSGRRPELPPQGFCSIVFKLIALQVNIFTQKDSLSRISKKFFFAIAFKP